MINKQKKQRNKSLFQANQNPFTDLRKRGETVYPPPADRYGRIYRRPAVLQLGTGVGAI